MLFARSHNGFRHAAQGHPGRSRSRQAAEAPRAIKPPVDPVDADPPPAPRRRLLAAHPGLPRRRRGRVPRSQLAGEEHDHERRRSCSRAVQELVSPQLHRRRRARASTTRRCRVRVSPYLLSLIDWTRPVRRSAAPPVHPARLARCCPITRSSTLDSLHEQADAPVPGLTHRYPDKALFLALDTCPVYCRFCTRSYAVGVDTDEVEKVRLKVTEERWERAFHYIADAPRARGHRHLAAATATSSRRRQITLDRRRAARACRTSAASASRPRVRRSCRRRSSPTTSGSTR